MSVNDIMDDLEQEIKDKKYVAGLDETVPLSTVIDRIISEDKETKRKISEG